MGLPELNLMPNSRVWDDEPQPPRRERLWLKDGKKCHWCGRPTRLVPGDPPDQATTDHVIPRWRGGSNEDDNVVSACRACNARRNSEDLAGLKEGALLGNGTALVTGNHHPHRIVLSGDEKRELIARISGRPVTMKKEAVILEQRDQALKTVEALREKLKKAETTILAQEQRLNTMTIWQVIRRDLVAWLKTIEENDGV